MPLASSLEHRNRDPLIAIIVSVIIGSILTVYPLSYALAGWRPLVMLIITLCWVLCQPTWCWVWFAFAMGIFSDLLLDAPLGMHALSFVTLSFLARYFTREHRIMSLGKLWIIAYIAITAHLMFTWLAFAMSGMDFSIARHWQPMLSSVLLWPLFYYCLKPWRI